MGFEKPKHCKNIKIYEWSKVFFWGRLDFTLLKFAGVWVDGNNEVMYAMASKITFICQMDFNAFPVDIQVDIYVIHEAGIWNLKHINHLSRLHMKLKCEISSTLIQVFLLPEVFPFCVSLINIPTAIYHPIKSSFLKILPSSSDDHLSFSLEISCSNKCILENEMYHHTPLLPKICDLSQRKIVGQESNCLFSRCANFGWAASTIRWAR